MRLGLSQRISKLERSSCDTATHEHVEPDPVAFARSLGLEPDPWQRDLLRSEAPRIIENCCRQSGKTVITGIKALHYALTNPRALILVLSPSLRQSSELFRTISYNYRDLGRPVGVKAETTLKLELENRSRIISLPGREQTIRGYSGVNLLIIDEASRVPDDLYYAVRPMLAVSRGKLILLSTPHGQRGFFHDTWINGGSEWLKIKITADQCPRISQEFLEEERKTLGEWWYSQEYFCTFAENQTSLFRYESIMAAAVDDPNYDDWGKWIKG